ncbi:MAG: hypothetical protein AAB706_03430 [Patescibacteria group bacterium]
MGDLLESKKFRAALAAIGVALLCMLLKRVGVAVSEEQMYTLLAPLLVYIGAQGVADLGKAKALPPKE